MKKKFLKLIKPVFLFTVGLSLTIGCNYSNGDSGVVDPGIVIKSVTESIDHEAGGKIQLNDEVSLNIPAGSLSEDKEITIEKISESPEGGADGLSQFGQAYRLLPAGTTFDLSKPAILEIKYDSATMSNMGLSSQTTQMYYFDNELNKYINVACDVNTAEGKITAYIEHFTIYLAMAKTMIPGNNTPYAALRNPVPNPIRADAPIYIRATARDYDIGGSLAGVKLSYRKLNPGSGAWQEVYMTPEIRPNSLDAYGYLIPANFLTSADLGGGDDIEYYITVTDNLGAVTTTATVSQDVTRSYQAGSIYMTPGTQNMTAGFERYFNVRGTDNLATNFTFVPELVSITDDIGTFEEHKARGILFHAEKTVIATLEAGFGSEIATADITVFNGPLESISILDENSLPIDGTMSIKEGHLYQFDIIGYDTFGNTICVLPAWSANSSILGTIDQDALLYTLDGSGLDFISAVLGSVSDVQWINVLDREWVQKGGSLNVNVSKLAYSPSLAFNGATPYVTWFENNSTNTAHQIYVKHWNGSNWIQVGGSLNINTSKPACHPSIAFNGATPYVTWNEYNGTANLLYVKHWNGSNWIQNGGNLNIDTSKSAGNPSIAFNGATPYVIWQENNSQGTQIYVKHWNGSNWIQDGGSLNVDTSKQAYAPSLVFNGVTLYATWKESNGTADQIYVKHWNGSSWIQVGGSLNVDTSKSANYPIIAFNGAIPYVTWNEYNGTASQIYVKHWNGSSWIQDGGSLNIDASKSAMTPSLAFNGTTPYVTWRDQSDTQTQIYVKHWNGSNWIQDGGSLNVSTSKAAHSPSLAFNGATPYVTWFESSSSAFQIYVKALE